MTADFAYDPVTVIDEANAVRETAVLFAEIRQIMRIPLVTSIWRGLAGMEIACAWLGRREADLRKRRARARAGAQCCCGRLAPSGTVGAHRTCLRELAESDVIATRCHRCLQGFGSLAGYCCHAR